MKSSQDCAFVTILLLMTLAGSGGASAPTEARPQDALVVIVSRNFVGMGAGNGFVVGDGTLVLTNDHVVVEKSSEGEHRVESFVSVFSPHLGQACDVRVLATDERLDLAVLEVPWKGHPALALADANAITSARSARVLGLPAVVQRMDAWNAGAPSVEEFRADAEELPVGFIGARRGDPRVVMLVGTGRLRPGWSGAPMVLPDTGTAIGCFASIDSTVRGSQVLRRDARGPAVCQVAQLLGDGWSERLARPSQTHLESPADAREACSLALKASALLRPDGYESVPELIRAFLELRPDSVFGHRVLAYASDKLGHTDAARESYERALELEPNSFSVQLLYAQLLADNGEQEKAWQVLEPLAGSGRSNDLVTIAFVNILSEQRRFDRCLQILENAVRISPRNGYLWQQMAACRLQLRGPQAAIGPLTRVVELLPETGSFRGTLARLLETMGVLDEAEKHYRELLEVEPANPVVYYWLARFLREHRPQARREALAVAEKALDLPPHSSLPREKIEELIDDLRADVVGRMETEPDQI